MTSRNPEMKTAVLKEKSV